MGWSISVKLMIIMTNAKHVHFIGIGGIGTSAAAKWWLAQGATVTGSDAHASDITKSLEAKGIAIKYGHAAENVPADCDLVIYSRAVQKQTRNDRSPKNEASSNGPTRNSSANFHERTKRSPFPAPTARVPPQR